MDQYNLLLQLLKQNIENDDINELQNNLLLIPFEQLKQNTVDKLLSYIVNLTPLYNSQHSIKCIFDTCYKLLPLNNGNLDHLTRLFCDITVTKEALLLVAQTYSSTHPLEYYIEHLIDYDGQPMTMIGAKNLDDIFNVTNDIWQYLFKKSVENEIRKGYTNRLIKEFIEMKMVETALFLPAPTWIINDSTICLDNYNDNYVDVLTDDEQKQLSVMTDPLSIYRYKLNFDQTLFKLFGPANVQMSENLLLDDICHIYGGCRMLLCQEYEEQYLDDESVDDMSYGYDNDAFNKTHWFTGICDTCLNKIEFLHYAVRLPLYNGGWKGCYCSWDCVRKTLLLPNEIVTFELIDLFEKQINEIGIQDRVYE
ncbi:MAG TPA: hypothetical protein VLG50_06685 [Candidatus Saccharimonadales bacterium]|nr:hypothetical protein [Candidatus Saccharimonadales bacterium]